MNELPDNVVLEAFPLLAVPSSGTVPANSRNGLRYLVARDGLYKEVTTPWLRAVLPCSPAVLGTTPYGPLVPGVELTCGTLPLDLIREFTAHARGALPNETTAVLAWNWARGSWRLVHREEESASRARVVYREARLEEEEVLVVDLHSHGDEDAFFSAEDDRDDAGGIKISAVVGRVRTEPTLRARLACLDRFVDLQLDSPGAVRCAECRA